MPALAGRLDVRGNALRLRGAIVRRVRFRRLRSIIGPADVLTLGNAFSGLLAIAVLTGVVNLYDPPFFPSLAEVWPAVADDRFLLATLLIALGLTFDSMDGIVARKFGGSSLGGDLDTLADAVTFVVVPAIMVMEAYGDAMSFRAFLTGALIFIMGILRLARFNSNPVEGETKVFQGLPTPWCASTVALATLTGIPGRFALPLFVILAFLMMSSFAYPKARERVRYLTYFMIASAAVIVGLLFYFPNDQSRIVRTSFVLVALTVAIFPFLIARRERRARRLRETSDDGERAGAMKRA